MDELRKAQGLVHLSFDMWTSRNCLALNGVVAHYQSVDGAAMTLLLALPEHEGEHIGANIAGSVAAIIQAFRIDNRISYFVLDNASNNDATIHKLAEQFGFVADERRLRCMGHVVNLVAKQLLFGDEPELFELEASVVAACELRKAIQLWRNRGPIGKLHNVVTWIYRSPQRRQRFLTVQQSLLEESAIIFGDNEDQRPHDLYLDNSTRWNSTYQMILQAVKLRLAIDDFINQERQRYERVVSNTERNARRYHSSREVVNQTPPSILDDALSTDDWDVLTIYLDILQPLDEVTKELQGRPGEN